MHGLILIDKPAGITSHDVVNRVRRILRIKRVGHTGTLDPFATGLMVILIGQATRLAQYLDKDEKEYEAIVQFGSETDTGDRTGVTTAACGLSDDELEERVGSIDWETVLSKFRGEITQVPPMYSAKKVAGKKLYELARKGEEVERKPLAVTISKLEVLNKFPTPKSAFCIRVACSAGTYIRTLAEDIGRAAGPGAHLAELRRTRAGRFDISNAVTLEELEDATDRSRFVISMSEAVGHLPVLHLNEDRVGKTRNGLSSRITEEFAPGNDVRMLDPAGHLVAVGEFNEAEKTVQPKVVFGLESE